MRSSTAAGASRRRSRLGFGRDAKLTLSYFHLEQDNVPDYGIPWVPNTQAVLPPRFWNKPSPVDFDNFYGLLDRDKEEIITDIATLTLRAEGRRLVQPAKHHLATARRTAIRSRPRRVTSRT